MYKKILLPTDGSASSLKAAEAAAEIAQRFEGQILMLYVFNPAIVPVPFTGLSGLPMGEGDDMGQYAHKVQSEIEEETGKVLRDFGVEFKTRQELGHPVDRIVSVAHDEQSDLIVMGSRGLGSMKSLLLGSVSDGVLHHAHCPVLIVR